MPRHFSCYVTTSNIDVTFLLKLCSDVMKLSFDVLRDVASYFVLKIPALPISTDVAAMSRHYKVTSLKLSTQCRDILSWCYDIELMSRHYSFGVATLSLCRYILQPMSQHGSLSIQYSFLLLFRYILLLFLQIST